MLKRILPTPDLERRKKIGLNDLIEGLLDLALIASFLAAVGWLITFAIRFVFWL
jgi:hypothetical protein